ncbi:MAG: NADP-dependent oxidoreductase [Gemmatimonadaceae bacterium]
MATKKKKGRSKGSKKQARKASKKRASKPSSAKRKAARKTRATAARKRKPIPARAKKASAATKKASAATKKVPAATMKAAAIDRYGPPEVLTIHTLPVPKVGPNDVLIALHSAGVGVWDADIRSGSYSSGSKQFPRVLGTDGAGVVVEVGKDVDGLKEGDKVWAYEWGSSKVGFYAEYVAPNAKNVVSAPNELSLLEAGAAVVTGLTALQGVDDHLKLDKSDTILVFGATGAVGSLAVQFAKRTGAHVVATASPGRAETTLREIGIEQVFDPRAADASQRLRSFASGGLNAVLAFAGGDDLEQCIDQLVADGRVAYPNGIDPEPRKRPKLRMIPYDAVGGRAPLERLNRAVTESRLKVVIEKVYKLEQAAEAHARIEQGHVVGRIVLQIR